MAENRQAITRRVQSMPVAELKAYIEVRKKKLTARRAFIEALKCVANSEEAATVRLEAIEDLAEDQYWTWKAHARLGELLGPGIQGQHALSKSLERDDHNARYFARRFYKADQTGKLEKLLAQMKTYHEILRYSAPIGADAIASNFTGNNDNYTPASMIKLVKQAMGGIDLDPASCLLAQEVVQAKRFLAKEDNPLEQEWRGRIFLNPPYAAKLINLFVEKLVACPYEQAILLTNDNTDTKWWHLAYRSATAVCFVAGRIHFYTAEKKETLPTNGQTFFYFGKDISVFKKVFSEIGIVQKVML